MSYQSQGPEVYQYHSHAGPATSVEGRIPLYPQQLASFNVNRSIDNYAPIPPTPGLKRFGQSQIQIVYQPLPSRQHITPNQTNFTRVAPSKGLVHQYHTINQPHESNDTVISSINMKRNEAPNANQNRFDDYLVTDRSYKYNFFSVIDQPWNNCLRGQKCGSLPSNECIARHTK